MASQADGVLTFVCLGSGPSITQEDVDYVRGKAKVICVNDTYRLAPWADYLYACDAKWWEHHIGDVGRLFQGELFTIQSSAVNRYGLQWKPDAAKPGLGKDCIHHGKNSGYQAVNLAYLLGATRVLLLGYDMQKLNGQRHFFGEHPEGPMRQDSPYTEFIEAFKTIDTDMEIINCSRQTALTCFPSRPLRGCL